jgi:hypothetical protein
MEIFIAVGIVLLAVLGLGLGSFFGRGPVKGSCGGMACIKDIACEGCPNRKPEGKA